MFNDEERVFYVTIDDKEVEIIGMKIEKMNLMN